MNKFPIKSTIYLNLDMNTYELHEQGSISSTRSLLVIFQATTLLFSLSLKILDTLTRNLAKTR